MSITQPSSSSLSLLCVDDDIWILDALKKYFEHEPDISFHTRSSALEALELLNSQHFDAIICDYTMPGMDGIALLKEIRSRGDDTLFIIFTGRHIAKVAIDTLNYGGNYYLQKSVNLLSEMPKVLDYIRSHINNAHAPGTTQPSDSPFHLLVENQLDPVCCFSADGEIRYTNRSFKRDIESGMNEEEITDFFSIIPDNELEGLLINLKSLSVIHPNAHVEHHIRIPDGSLTLYLWNYRAITDESGEITGYTTQGINLSDRICLSLPAPHLQSGAGPDPELITTELSTAGPVSSEPVEKIKDIQDHFADLVNSVENVQYPIFVIDRTGVIIGWNRAIAELTGVEAAEIIGKGDHAYSAAIYGDIRPMLIDYLFDPLNGRELKALGITRDGDSLTGDIEKVTIQGKPLHLWSKGAVIYDPQGSVIAAVQSILVSDEQSENKVHAHPEREIYIGGISSIILKVTGNGMSGAIAGAIGLTEGGYGVYATSRRLFVIRNSASDARRNDLVQFGTFVIDELFGTNIDIRPRLIEELEHRKVFEVWRSDITSIELKKPRLLAGFLILNTASGESFRVYVDHTKAFVHLEQLFRMFYPELLIKSTKDAEDDEMRWLEDVQAYKIDSNFSIENPLEDIGRTTHHIPAALKRVNVPITRPLNGTSREWKDLSDAVRFVPYPIFAIDRGGKVIAWNREIETLTGIAARHMIGKGDHAYAVPFYGSARPMLIDYIVMPPDAPVTGDIPSITRDGDTFIGDLENVTIREKPLAIWGKGTGIYDAQGVTIAAIQSILVNEPPTVKTILGILEQEKYIGGISSITVKLGSAGISGSIAGAIGSTTGGYGVYATDQRLFVIHNPELDASRSGGISFGTFIIDELFGTTVDTRPRRIEELEDKKVIQIGRKDITSIEMKKPQLLAGYIFIRTRAGEVCRIYIDHKKAFIHIDQLLRLFYPEILRIE